MRAATPQLESPRVKASIIDRRIENYASQGLTRGAILQQLLAARWPLEQLRTRFPEMQEGAFAYPADPRTPQPRNATSANATTAPTGPIPAVSNVLPSVPATNIGRAPLNALSAASTSVDGISFQYVPLIQCSFPHADPKHASTFTRKNGWLELTLGTTRPEAGLPYGVPARLLTIYCTSEAVRTNSPEIYLGDSVHDFLRRLDVPITRGARGV